MRDSEGILNGFKHDNARNNITRSKMQRQTKACQVVTVTARILSWSCRAVFCSFPFISLESSPRQRIPGLGCRFSDRRVGSFSGLFPKLVSLSRIEQWQGSLAPGSPETKKKRQAPLWPLKWPKSMGIDKIDQRWDAQ